MGRTCRRADEIELTPTGAALNGLWDVPAPRVVRAPAAVCLHAVRHAIERAGAPPPAHDPLAPLAITAGTAATAAAAAAAVAGTSAAPTTPATPHAPHAAAGTAAAGGALVVLVVGPILGALAELKAALPVVGRAPLAGLLPVQQLDRPVPLHRLAREQQPRPRLELFEPEPADGKSVRE